MNTMNLHQASQQWATRPPDESFPTVEALHAACVHFRDTSATKNVPMNVLRVEADGARGEINLLGKQGVPARLTHYAFGQLAAKAGAPAGYLRQLPATLAAQNLNHGLARGADATDAQLYFQANGELLLRAITSTAYARIHDAEVTARLLILQQEMGWTPPPPAWGDGPNSRIATAEELQGRRTIVKPGDRVIDAGLYASFQNMFAFMVNERYAVEVEGQTLARGFFVTNSEVGDAKLRLLTFLYDYVCGNHNVWGARDVCEIEIIHRGNAARISDKAFRNMEASLHKYLNSGTSGDVERILTARRTFIAADKDKVLDKLFGIRSLSLTRKVLSDAYDVAQNTPRYGDPRTVWGMTQGLTQVSQRSPFADERTSIDRAAGKLIDINF